MDGGTITAPNLGIWTSEGFIVENEGVPPPDVEGEQTPADVIAGKDPQLDPPPARPEKPPPADPAEEGGAPAVLGEGAEREAVRVGVANGIRIRVAAMKGHDGRRGLDQKLQLHVRHARTDGAAKATLADSLAHRGKHERCGDEGGNAVPEGGRVVKIKRLGTAVANELQRLYVTLLRISLDRVLQFVPFRPHHLDSLEKL